MARASTNYVPGDRLLLKRGDTWNEELRPKGNGTPSKPITISSYGKGNRPVIDRQDYNKDRTGIHLVDQGGFKIVGIEFARCMTGIYGEYSDDCPTKRFIWIEDCYFHDSLKYQHYENYPKRKIGLGVCFFSYERDNRIVLTDIMVKNCVFRRLASGFWTNSPDNFNKYAGRHYNFGNLTFEDCLFEEGYQWQMGIRGVAGGAVRNCVTHDIGRNFRSFNGVAGAMFFRCKDWIFEDSEWGYISIGNGSGDGEAFDFEGTCDNMLMRNCLFHDTDGPGFLICCYASSPEPSRNIVMENCVLNGKAKRPIGLPRCEIINTTDWNEVAWKDCRFYLSPGEVLMKVMDPEKEKRSSFSNCVVKSLSSACSTRNLAAEAKATASSQTPGNQASSVIDQNAASSWKAATPKDQWLQLEFSDRTTINEFRIKEDPSSSIVRYVIEYWDDKKFRWMSCFNGRAIGPSFVAPIVSRTTRKVRLRIMKTGSGRPGISEFEAFHDETVGQEFTASGHPIAPTAPVRPVAPPPPVATTKPAASTRPVATVVRGTFPLTVPVGDPGNAADSTSFGSVAYSYRIGKYEVTNTQYCEFLNAVAKNDPHGLYNGGMAGEFGGIRKGRSASGGFAYVVMPNRGNKPVNYVSLHDAIRFANWLTNGQGTGSTETGCYNLGNLRMPNHAALASGKTTKWVLTSENEWYKAAYYDPRKRGGAGYWKFATRSDNAPTNSGAPGTHPAANYNRGIAPSDVGAYTSSASPYGTFDQNGNMWEWNEAGGGRGLRGGSFFLNDNSGYLSSSTRYDNIPPKGEYPNYGFRVVALGASTAGASTAGVSNTQRRPAAPTKFDSDPEKDGYWLDGGVISALKETYKPAAVKNRSIASAGSSVITHRDSDASLRNRHLPTAGGYSYEIKWRAFRAFDLKTAVARRAKLNRPELVRICIVPQSALRGRVEASLAADLEHVLTSILDAGGIPVLYTLPVRTHLDRAARPADKVRLRSIKTFNDTVLSVARKLNVPVLHATAVLNASSDNAHLFKSSGLPQPKAHDLLNRTFATLYRALEQSVMGRALAAAEPGQPAASRATLRRTVVDEGDEEEEGGDVDVEPRTGEKDDAPQRGLGERSGRGQAAFAAPDNAKRSLVWDFTALFKVPKVHATQESPAPGMRAFFYEGAPYKGRPTQVFAYYAAPKGKPPAGGWPAVVCAHGGGGTAYPNWVNEWTNHGYAAIAMDLEGHLPGGNSHGLKGNLPTNRGHQNAGPARIDWFGDRDLPDKEQWFYHAVADVIRANSLLRSFPEINRKKIGLTGISWGGTVVSTVAGVDSRFVFVIPVYGGGFIHESDNPGLSQWFPPKHMTSAQYRDYRTKWDPAAHLSYAKMPMLFVSAVADPVFQIDIFAKSVQAAGGPSTLCIRPWMIHGHGSGWNDAPEIRNFADSIVKNGPPLPKFGRPQTNPGTGLVHTKYRGDITEAWVYYTTSGGTWKSRKWHFIQCTLGKEELVARKRLPRGTTGFLVYGFRVIRGQRSNHVCSELVQVKKAP